MQKTAYEMRISDWSSDVCSSDLVGMAQTRCRTLFPPAGCGFDPVLLLADFPLSRSDDAPRPDGGRRLLVRAGEDAACLGAATSVLSRSGATKIGRAHV